MTCYTWQELWVCDLDTAYVWVFGLKTSLASRHGNRVRKSAFHCWIWAQSKLPNQGERASALHLLCACDELDHEIMNCEAWKNSCLIIREFLSWLWAINFTWAKWFISLVGNHHAANLYWIWALEHRLRLVENESSRYGLSELNKGSYVSHNKWCNWCTCCRSINAKYGDQKQPVTNQFAFEIHFWAQYVIETSIETRDVFSLLALFLLLTWVAPCEEIRVLAPTCA